MIKSLRIRNLATIEELELGLERGFSILTGETEPENPSLSTPSASSWAIRDHRLHPNRKYGSLGRSGYRAPEMAETLKDLGLENGEELLIQRQISGVGPGKAYINGVLFRSENSRRARRRSPTSMARTITSSSSALENHLFYLDAFLDAGFLRGSCPSGPRAEGGPPPEAGARVPEPGTRPKGWTFWPSRSGK